MRSIAFKKIAFIFFSFFISFIINYQNPLASQPPDTLWTKTFGGTNIDIGHCVEQTSDGGYIITGYTRSYGTMSGRNILLIKTDENGVAEWINGYGGNDDDEGYSVKQTPDGGYIIAGHTKSFGAGLKDVYLIKTDSLGTQQWSKTFGGAQDDEGYSVQLTSDGGYIIGGVTSSSGAGSRDMLLIKTDSDGNLIWQKTHGGMSSDGAWFVQNTSDGGYVLAGWTLSYGPGFIGNAWLVKTDSLGNQQWNKFFGGSDVDRGYCVQQTTDGGFILTGYTASFGAGLDDMLLVKTDSLGNQEWLKTFGGTGRDYGQSVQQTLDGGYIVVGYTLSYGAGGDDLWLVKADINGNQEWNITYGGSSSDVGYCITETSDGGYIITGHTLSFGAGVHDVWLIKTAPLITSFNESDLVDNKFYLYQNYPNPFNSSTTINYSINQSGFVRLKVFDLLGRQVQVLVDEFKSAGNYTVNFNAEELSAGIYFYQLSAENFTSTKKLILLK
jgi:hypothetical protein